MNTLLEVSGLQKNFAQFALQGLSFSLPGGAVMGFIGQNGAGKTTTIKAILGMLKRSGGSVRLFGQAFDGAELALREKIGVVMDAPFYPEEWTVQRVERALSPFYSKWDSGRYAALLQRFSLDPRKKIKELSRGMKVKLMLAVALSYEAKLLLLDEPTSGLDPVARDELMDILRDFVCDEQHAILFSTHITSDLEKIADYITFIQNGKMVFTGEKDRLLEDYCLLRGGRGELPEGLRGKILGLREHSAGFEALIPTALLAGLPAHMEANSCSLEDIMLHMSGKEQAI